MNISASSVNSSKFKSNNTVRKDSVKVLKKKVGFDGHVPHPVKTSTFQKFLNQTNVRRIFEGEQSKFKTSMGRFLEDKAKFNCLSLPSTRHGNCNCLKGLLAINSNIESVVDMVFSFWQLNLKERDSLFRNKVHNIMDGEIGTNLYQASNVRFRGRLFF